MPPRITLLVGRARTGGSISVFGQVTPPGYGPPLHRHLGQLETFHVVRGRHKFAIEGKEFIGLPGDCFLVPMGAAHAFKNIDAGEGMLHFTLLPAGTSEEYFAQLPLERDRDPLDLDFFRRHGVEIIGPPIE